MPQSQQARQSADQPAKQAPAQKAQPATPKHATPMIGGERLSDATRANQLMGYSRSRIRTFQRKLGVPDDGSFGRETTRAVFSYQLSHPELGNDGKLGPATAASLDTAPEQPVIAQALPSLSKTQVASALRYNRSHGFSKAAIIAMQHQIGANADGVLGPDTINAIASWQAEHGLTVDGKAGKSTTSRMGIDTSRSQPGEQRRTPGEAQAEANAQHSEEGAQQGHKEEKLSESSITASFTWLEFRSRGDNKGVPSAYRANVIELCEQLEALRKAFDGRSVRVNSGYRSPWWNRQVGGASNSQHLTGHAADVTVDGVSPSRVRAKILELIKQGKMKQGGVGKYSTFTHYDTRGSAARW